MIQLEEHHVEALLAFLNACDNVGCNWPEVEEQMLDMGIADPDDAIEAAAEALRGDDE